MNKVYSSQIEVTAAVFCLIKTNNHMEANRLHDLIKRELSFYASDDQIAKAYLYLYKKARHD